MGTQNSFRKHEDSQQPKLELQKKIEIDNITVEILTREERATFYKWQTRTDLEIVPPSTLASLIRNCGHPNDEPRRRNMDTLKRTQKSDSIEKKIQEKDSGQKER